MPGVLMMTIFVRGVIAFSNSSAVIFQPFCSLGLDEDRISAGEAHHLRIAQPVGAGNDHFVARLAGGEDGVEAGLLGAVGNDDLARLVLDACYRPANFSAMAWRSSGMPELGVYFVKPLLDASHGGGLDVIGRVEIGFAGREAADVDAFGLHGLGFASRWKGLATG